MYGLLLFFNSFLCNNNNNNKNNNLQPTHFFLHWMYLEESAILWENIP
jgi:hypothetical protein